MGSLSHRGEQLLIPLWGAGYSDKVLDYGPIAYWSLDEASGSTAYCQVNSAQNGSYTGVALGQPGIGDGNLCPLFNGANDYVDVYTTAFRDAFNGAEGTFLVWMKVSGVGVWSDAAFRKPFVLQADANNYVMVFKNAADANAYFRYSAGGTLKQAVKASGSTIDWVPIALTWSASADQFIAYWDGTRVGAIQTGLGAWAGVLASTTTVLGAQDTVPGQVWDGFEAHAAIWNKALTSTQIADLAVA